MQTIQIKYLPATHTKPARLVARTAARRHIVSVDKLDNLPAVPSVAEDNQRYAKLAEAVMLDLAWSGRMIGGHNPDGSFSWVFAHASPEITV